jgi:urease accessory protein
MKTRPSVQIPRVLAFLLALALYVATMPHAQAHIIPGESISFRGGFMHPLSGWDHIIAMVAVGIWGAQLGEPAIWLLPVVFPFIMCIGGFLGILRVPVPFGVHMVEYGIALSGIVLGLMVLGSFRPKLYWAAIIVGFFGLCHGYAHGHELPMGESGLYYSMGFVLATGLLHLTGICIGLVHRWPIGRQVIRVCGAGIMLGGFYFMWQAFQPEPPEAAPAPSAFVAPAPGALEYHG